MCVCWFAHTRRNSAPLSKISTPGILIFLGDKIELRSAGSLTLARVLQESHKIFFFFHTQALANPDLRQAGKREGHKKERERRRKGDRYRDGGNGEGREGGK